MAKKNIRVFLGSFVLTIILIGGFCGFIMVDLSTDRYMPGDYEPIFLISELGPQGASLSLMGKGYRIDTQQLLSAEDIALRLQGILPASMRLAGAAVTQSVEYFRGLVDQMEER